MCQTSNWTIGSGSGWSSSSSRRVRTRTELFIYQKLCKTIQSYVGHYLLAQSPSIVLRSKNRIEDSSGSSNTKSSTHHQPCQPCLWLLRWVYQQFDCNLMVGLVHPNYCTHGHGKQSKTLSSRLVNVWNKHQKKFSLNQVQQGSEILNLVQTQNWTCGLVLHNHRTLDWTSVRFWKVQVQTLVQNRTAASLSVGVYIWTVQSVPHKGFSLIDWPLICPWCLPWGTLLSIPFGPLQTVEIVVCLAWPQAIGQAKPSQTDGLRQLLAQPKSRKAKAKPWGRGFWEGVL